MAVAARALGLVRVSKERGRGDDLLSPEIQRTAITDHVTKHGEQLVGWLEGIDQSGSQARSDWWATLDEAVELVEAGQVDVLVVWKFSRLARRRLRWAVAVDRVEAAGGRIESATEGFDTTTSSGRFARGMLGELQAFEAERIGEVWREVQVNRVGKGLTHNGRARFGYVCDEGLHRPDADTADVVRDLFRRYVAGEGFYTLAGSLNAAGHRTTTGGLWTDGTLRRGMDSGFYAGLVSYAGEQVPGAHEPLVDADTWQAYLDARARRARQHPRRERSPYLLSGLVRCAWCNGGMNGGTFGKGRTPKYRCETRRATAGAGCSAGYVSAAAVHEAVRAWLAEVGDELDAAARIAEAATATRSSHAADATRLAREVTRLEAALVRLAQQHAEDEHADELTYRAARDDYRRRLAETREQHERSAIASRTLPAAPSAVVGPLVDEWDTLPVVERRELLRRIVAHVDVRTAGPRQAPTVRVVPTWETADA